MKTINNYILEKLKISKTSEYILFPKNLDELVEMIKEEIEQNGNECSLNHIDTSKITSMQKLFYNSMFNGDISEWDVSNVTDMNCMFYNSYFNGDISEWNVSNVEDMYSMFRRSDFNGDISKWDISNVEKMSYMFYGSKFNKPLNKWNVSNVKYMNYMFDGAKDFNQDISMWKINDKCMVIDMITNCSIEDKYKPKGIK